MAFNYAFVDFQGFKNNSNGFIVKEIALVTRNLQLHDIIKSPYALCTLDEDHRKQVNWLTKNYHGLGWNDGYITLNELRKTILPILRQKTVFVKGTGKIKWLEYILECNMATINRKICQIFNLEESEIECSISLHKKNVNNYNDGGYHICKHHRHLQNMNNRKCQCALENVLVLKDWYIKQQQNRNYLRLHH